MTSPNITSPCSRLNDDVLQEIFARCAVTFYVRHLSRVRTSICPYPQLSVSQVCSSWRHVALLTPHLWNNICIHDLNEATLRIAREYLSRAWSLPISLMLGGLDQIGHGPHGWRSLLTEFFSSYRLRSLTAFEETANICLIILPDLPQRSVADLEKLWLNDGLWRNDGLGLGESVDAFIHLNDIRYPKLAVIGFTCKVSGCSSLLREFDGRGVMMTVIESGDLSRCPSLETCLFAMLKEDGSSPGPVSVPRILLQHLHMLIIDPGRRRVMPFSTFIEALALPNFENLIVTHPRVAWSATAFQSFAQRSNRFPNLRHFVLKGATSDVDAGPILASMPSITSIRLCDGCHPSRPQAIFDHITLNGLASGSLAPQLQTLQVGYISNVGEFMDMVESRMKNARMSSNGVPAPFTLVHFRERGLEDESDHLQ